MAFKLPELQALLGYEFRDTRLLQRALTHTSFVNEEDFVSTGANEELEWYGDTVLQMAISSWLYKTTRAPRSAQRLSQMRQRFVEAGACHAFAHRLSLVNYIRLGHNQESRGTKILADCFEALLAAIYLDSGSMAPIHGLMASLIPSYTVAAAADAPADAPLRGYWPPPPPPALRPGSPPQSSPSESNKLMNAAHKLAQAAKALRRPMTPPPMRAATPGLVSQAPSAGTTASPLRLIQGAEFPGGPPGLAAGLGPLGTEPLRGDGDGRALGFRGGVSASRGSSPLSGGQLSPPDAHQQARAQADFSQALRDFLTALQSFQASVMREGMLSCCTPFFCSTFGEDVSVFFQEALSDRAKLGDRMEQALLGTSPLRQHFPHAPDGAERVVMEAVLVAPPERLAHFTALEFVFDSLLDEKRSGGIGGGAGGSGGGGGAAAAPPPGAPGGSVSTQTRVLSALRSLPMGRAALSQLKRTFDLGAEYVLFLRTQRATARAWVAAACFEGATAAPAATDWLHAQLNGPFGGLQIGAPAAVALAASPQAADHHCGGSGGSRSNGGGDGSNNGHNDGGGGGGGAWSPWGGGADGHQVGFSDGVRQGAYLTDDGASQIRRVGSGHTLGGYATSARSSPLPSHSPLPEAVTVGGPVLSSVRWQEQEEHTQQQGHQQHGRRSASPGTLPSPPPSVSPQEAWQQNQGSQQQQRQQSGYAGAPRGRAGMARGLTGPRPYGGGPAGQPRPFARPGPPGAWTHQGRGVPRRGPPPQSPPPQYQQPHPAGRGMPRGGWHAPREWG